MEVPQPPPPVVLEVPQPPPPPPPLPVQAPTAPIAAQGVASAGEREKDGGVGGETAIDDAAAQKKERERMQARK